MPKDVMYGKTLRKSFARTQEIMDMPNLLEIQKSSYKWFLETGLREVFRDVDSVTDYSGNLELSFIDYSMNEKPKYSEEECKARDATYAAPLKVRVRLRNKETEEIKEQEIFMGDFPLMTDGGTFIINGAERVIVSQIVRSPGVYFDKTVDKAMMATYGSTVIPYHGAWLEYETDANDVFNVRIDKNRKLPITWFLKAMGQYKAELDEKGAFKPESCATWLSCVADPTVGAVTNERIREIFGEDERIVATLDKDTCPSPGTSACWRSTASCARAIPPRWNPPRPCWRASSSTAAATRSATWAATSSTRSSPSSRASRALSWPPPWPTPSPASFWPSPAPSSAARRPARSRTPAWWTCC